MDEKMMQLLAESMARTAAQELMVELRTEISEQFAGMKREMSDELAEKFAQHFGKIEPSAHIVQHNRLGSWINWFDEFQSKMWTRFAMILMSVACFSMTAAFVLPFVVKQLMSK